MVDVGDNGHFVRVVKAAFAHRRKTLLNSLKSDSRLGTAQDVAGALERCNIAATRRAETLSVEEFGRLALALSPSDGGV
jgi:16S rRNA (adenine1518-N6/adenine1519-N6)-dimethyltransferase